MAFVQVNYMSRALNRTVPLRVATPGDKAIPSGYANKAGTKYKLLILLQGFYGSHVDWMNATRVQKWAETNNFMVAMPAGDNSFYVDWPLPDEAYGRMIGEELPEVMRAMFPVSERYEDMWIAGLSMGGFGAMRNGLKYADTFSRVICFSSKSLGMFDGTLAEPTKSRVEAIMGGDMEAAKNSDKNPHWLAKELMERHKADPSVRIPEIYMSCGTEDPAYPTTAAMRDELRELGYNVMWDEGPGVHAWTFWGPQLQNVIANFLPLDDSVEGIDSGHVQSQAFKEAEAAENADEAK
ncbi:MAG: hypothetical protein IJH87_04715 [Atopobiaceae bacterium]|nr:hypothetical protein [Atopobiaceae bacterium]